MIGVGGVQDIAHAVFNGLAKTQPINRAWPCSSILAAADSLRVKRLSPKRSMTWRSRAKIASPSKLPAPPRSASHACTHTRAAVVAVPSGQPVADQFSRGCCEAEAKGGAQTAEGYRGRQGRNVRNNKARTRRAFWSVS